MQVRVIREHEIPDRAPLRVSPGEVVQVGPTDVVWPQFVYVTATTGEGWVPGHHLDGDGPTAVVRTAYDTQEIAVVPGQVLELLTDDPISRWAWCRTEDGAQGWVPHLVLDGYRQAALGESPPT